MRAKGFAIVMSNGGRANNALAPRGPTKCRRLHKQAINPRLFQKTLQERLGTEIIPRRLDASACLSSSGSPNAPQAHRRAAGPGRYHVLGPASPIVASGQKKSRRTEPGTGTGKQLDGLKSSQKCEYLLLLFFGEAQRLYFRVKIGVGAAAPVVEFDHVFECG